LHVLKALRLKLYIVGVFRSFNPFLGQVAQRQDNTRTVLVSVGSANKINKLSLIGMQLPEKYEENFERRLFVWTKSGKARVIFSISSSNSRRRALARNVEILQIYFQEVAFLPTKVCSGNATDFSDFLNRSKIVR
jgi:hypothetical protein